MKTVTKNSGAICLKSPQTDLRLNATWSDVIADTSNVKKKIAIAIIIPLSRAELLDCFINRMIAKTKANVKAILEPAMEIHDDSE